MSLANQKTIFVSCILFLLSTIVYKVCDAEVFYDDFNEAHNYLTEGVTGTGWSGFVGLDPNNETADALNSDINHPGQLYIQSTGSFWEPNWPPLGPFLYKEVAGSFIATVRVTDFAGTLENRVLHNDCFIMARVADLGAAGDGEDFECVHYFPTHVANMGRDMDIDQNICCGTYPGEAEWGRIGEYVKGDDTFALAQEYILLERRGNIFYFMISEDGVHWQSLDTSDSPFNLNGSCIERPDLDGLPLQVGLAHATYSDATGYVAFDDFTLYEYGPVIYVDANADGTNNGTSWDDAYIYLQDALCDPNLFGPVQIWVAEGTYKPDQGGGQTPGDREATFQLINDVAIYGGFPSGGGSWASRDPNIHQTILSGDLNGNDEPNWVNNNENSYHVVTGSGTDESAILDGFTITAGNAESVGRGGGIFNIGSSSPTLTDCVFSGNSAIYWGGGMFNYNNSNPTLIDCKFSGNSAGDWGGGIHNEYSSPTLTNCTFSGNTAFAGGGMYNYNNSNPTLTDCTLSGNSANYGGGIYNSESSPILTNCTFNENSAEDEGGGMRNISSSNPSLTNCTFRRNEADWGGGMLNFVSSPTVANCTFRENSAVAYGGGMYNTTNGSPTLTNCTFIGNAANTSGGMCNHNNSSPAVSNCTFSGNTAVYDGGGMFNNNNSSPAVSNCTFSGNTAGYVGGGMYNKDSSPTVSNCTFNGNEAYFGGGMGDQNSSSMVTSCTFSGNTADNGGRGGGMVIIENSSPTLNSCDFISNSAEQFGGGLYNDLSSPEVTNCTFTGNSAADDGGGMYNSGSGFFLTNCVFRENSGYTGGGICISDSNIVMTNCTFGGNSAEASGGGIFIDYNGASTLNNCILWGNISNQIEVEEGGYVTVTYSCIQGGWPGVGNIDANPQFRDNEGHLFSGSPCRNAGDPNFVPDPNYPFDMDGDPRVIEEWVDMGADELYPPIQNTDTGATYDTIQEAIDDANDGETIVVQCGIYFPPGYSGIDFLGKAITLRSSDPNDPNIVATTTIDGLDWSRGFFFHSGEDANSVLDGFTIINGQVEGGGGAVYCDNSSPTISRCIIRNNDAWMGGGIFCGSSNPTIESCIIKDNSASEGGGIFCINSSPTIDGGTIRDNGPDGIWLDYDSTVQILDTVRIISNNVVGDGFVNIDPDAALNLDDAEIFANMVGVGTMEVDLGAQLTIDGDAVIDLGDPCDPNVKGTIDCDGVLEVKDNAQITNANINISRASFTDDVNVSNSVVTIDANAPYGQFFIDDNAIFINNDIYATGDRYMNLDPNIFSGLFVYNRIFVTITEGVGQTRGGLFECRGEDGFADVNSCDPNNTFFCRANPGTIPDCNIETWSLELLELKAGAKVNLTNRFPFQPPYDPGDDYDVVYVKKLILRQDSVLNTSYNTIYYDILIKEPNAMIKNEPLLGFSMINIAFDNQIEFIARVTHNNYTDPNLDPPDYSRTNVSRVVGFDPDPNGMMRMRNSKDLDPNSPHFQDIINARAKGLFSQSNEDEILIWFEYLFENSDPNTELIIYLTDVPELLDHNDPCRADHYIEVARLCPPPGGWAGSVGSGCFGTFQQYASSQDLDFIRGTRLEFELTGPQDNSVLINNWDPQVHCSLIYCADVTGDVAVTVMDFLTVVGGCGSPAELTPEGDSTVCLDGVFSNDGTVDSDDIISWDWLLNSPDRLSLCGVPLTEGMGMSSASDGVPVGSEQIDILSSALPVSLSDLIIAGKRGTSNDLTKLKDYLYVFDDQGQYIDGFEPVPNRANTKLVMDADGELYQLNYEDGLIRLSDGNSIVPSGTLPAVSEPRYSSSATVFVGLQGEVDDWWGRPIADATFDADGYLYVVPVVVEPPGEEAYTAAAKLELEPGETPPYSVVRLYDDPDADLPGDNRELNALREIEVDDAGNLYVVNAHTLNDSDILWKYDTDTGVMQDRLYLSAAGGDIDIPAPIAMCLSEYDSLLYLASSKNEPDADSILIYGLSTDTLDLERTITVNGMGHINSIAEDPATGTLWVAGFIMEDIPEYLYSDEPPFYEPYLAEVQSDSNNVQALSLVGTADLALPLSIEWTGSTDNCEGADLNGNNEVDFADFAILANQWLQPPGSPSADIAPEAPDGFVDMMDLEILIKYWLVTGCLD